MTHLSDYSFLRKPFIIIIQSLFFLRVAWFTERAVSLTYLYLWFTYRIYNLDRFQCLHPKRFKQGELKSIATLLLLFMIPFQLLYGMNWKETRIHAWMLTCRLDLTSCKIKYEEGFANIFGHIFTKPETMWTKADQDLVIPTGKDHTLAVASWSMCSHVFLLLDDTRL